MNGLKVRKCDSIFAGLTLVPVDWAHFQRVLQGGDAAELASAVSNYYLLALMAGGEEVQFIRWEVPKSVTSPTPLTTLILGSVASLW